MKAIVTNNQDPENKGRIKVKIPELMGEKELPFWCIPKSGIPGMDWAPRVGDVVDVDPAVSGSGLLSAPPVYHGYFGYIKDDKFYPANQGVTKNQLVEITSRQLKTEHWLVQVTEGDKGGVVISAIDDRSQNKTPTITVKTTGEIQIDTGGQNATISVGDGNTVVNAGKAIVNANEVDLKGKTILGNGGSHLTLFEALETAFNTHVHTVTLSNGATTNSTPPTGGLPDSAKSRHEADT